MKQLFCLCILLLLSTSVQADLVTLRDGTRIEGRVETVDAKTVLIKSDNATHSVNRESVLSIEFGQVLITGITGGTFISRELRAKFIAPEGWTMSKQPGLNFLASKGQWVALGRIIPLEGVDENNKSVINGAVGGMLENIKDGKTTEPVPATWQNLKAVELELDSPSVKMLLRFIYFPDQLMLFAIAAPPDEYATAKNCLADWEKGFSLITD